MKKLLVIFAFAIIGTTNAFSQEQTNTLYDVYLGMALDAYADGNYESSINWLSKASKYAKENFGEQHLTYAISLDCFALCYGALGDYTKAIEFGTKALETHKSVLGEDHPDYAASLNNLASYYSNLGNYTKAIELGTKALEIRKSALGEDHPAYATSLNNLALDYSNIGDYAKAIELNKEALEISKRALGESHPDYTLSLNNLAGYYSNIGDYAKAIEFGTKALEIRKRTLGESHPDYATSLNNLASYYSYLGDDTKAIELGTKALEILKSALGEDHPNYALSLNNLALYYSNIGNYTKAIELNKEALEISKRALGESHPDYTLSLNNLANYYSHLGDYTKAIEFGTKALEIRKSVLGEDHPDYAASLNNLASYYSDIGNYTKAIELGTKALEIRKSTLGEDHPNYARTLNNLAGYYSDISDYTKAIELGTKALEIRKSALGEDHPDYALSLNNLALDYSNIGNYTKAIELNKEALEISKRTLGEDHPDYAASLNNLAGCYGYLGDYAKAIELSTKALEILKSALGEDHPNYALSLNNLAVYYSNIGNYTKAIELGTKALEIRKSALGEDHPAYANSLGNIIYIYYKNKEIEKIPLLWQEYFSISRNFVLSQFKSLLQSQRQQFWASESYPIRLTMNTLGRYGKTDYIACTNTYNTLLLSKGAILASDIEFDKVIRESGDMVLLEKLEELRTTRAILNTYYNKPIAERPTSEVERLEARVDVLEADLIAGSKEYADFTRRLEIVWQDVLSALDKKDVAIEILAAEELIDEETSPYYAALMLRKGWETPQLVELCAKSDIERYKPFDSSSIQSNEKNPYKGYKSKQLYKLIWSKLEPFINEGDNVYFAPDGLLYLMNIEVLQDANGRRANEKWNLHRVSSTRELCLDKPDISLRRSALYGGLIYEMDSEDLIAQSRTYNRGEEYAATRGFVADSTMRKGWKYLEKTKNEIEEIAQMCKTHKIESDTYTAMAGNEESFKALSGRKIPIIHLATHGFFFKNNDTEDKKFFKLMDMERQSHKPDNSLKRSGLILAGGQKAWLGEPIPDNVEDGILLAEEIATMDLTGTDLVVLSACETGLGEITSEGVFGLQRAFKKAGVQTLIMSLWRVDDEATSLFMKTFYKKWLSGKSKHEAFAIAQQTVRDNENFTNPYYWAGFIMLD